MAAVQAWKDALDAAVYAYKDVWAWKDDLTAPVKASQDNFAMKAWKVG